MTSAQASTLPRWDLSAAFPSLDSSAFADEFKAVTKEIELFEGDLDRLRERGSVDEALDRFNRLLSRIGTLRAFVSAHTTTDSRDELALGRASEMDPIISRSGKIYKRLIAWFGEMEPDDLLENSEGARRHEFFIRRSKIAAAHQMTPELEALSSDLEPTGAVAWQRLYSNVTSQLTVSVGGRERPMSAVRAMASDPDRRVRQNAYELEIEAWKRTEVPIAAALNSIKGETLLLSKRRGWAAPLDAALFQANIDRSALDAMLSAARRSFPDFRRYLKLKAKALGLEKLAWFDLFAPIPKFSKAWSYPDAERFIETEFSAYSEKLGCFATRALADRWIDAEPRPGKVDGAYCSHLKGEESRVLLNYKPSFDSVSTFAHEMGHAYHNLCLSSRTAIQRATPMTLAETASIFCETVVRKAVQRKGTDAERGEAVQGALQGSTQVVVDITSRFLFEKSVFERRQHRELSSRELCEIMLESQRETYGDGLDDALMHPYMWAVKSHYYGRSFYNFPYMFGLLFGLGLYAIYEQDPERFKGRYDDLLSSTGMADAATLAAQFDIDIRSEDFWEGSLDRIREDVDLFERLIN
jgi:oligoendopeptidase F